MEGSSNHVLLEIEGTHIQCSRIDLIENSDYFKVMFEGDFVERNQDMIPLQVAEVKLEAMKIILKLLWDREHVIEESDLLPVLEAACMLQFLQVQKLCVEQIENMLRPENCLKIWMVTELLDIKEISNKAKLMALLEFMTIRDSVDFLELNVDQVINYLGNVNLQCSHEFKVYESVNSWYSNSDEQTYEILYRLIHCVDFSAITSSELYEIIAMQCMLQHDRIQQTMKCMLAMKNGDDFMNYREEYQSLADVLLHSKHRNTSGFPCILLDNVGNHSIKATVLYYDKYKRKKKYDVLENNPCDGFCVVHVDFLTHSLKKLFAVKGQKYESLEGFKVAGYKNFVFLYGGEFLKGKNWNFDFHIYDVIKDKWSTKKLPCARRHFVSCVCGKKIFIVGGTGAFRVIQDNLLWYNLESGKFSKTRDLPFSERQIKCCQFQNQLFILDRNNESGYLFDSESNEWTIFNICDANKILPSYSHRLTIFSYEDSIYIKEKNLFELKIKEKELIVVKEIALPQAQEEGTTYHQAESVLCNDTLYTLNKELIIETHRDVTYLELFKVKSNGISESYQRKDDDEIMKLDEENLKFGPSPLIIFNVFHPHLIGENDLISNLINIY